MSELENQLLDQIKAEENIFTKSRLLSKLREDSQLRVLQIAEYLELQSSEVCALARLIRIPELVSDGFYARLISRTHLYSLSRLKSPQQMIGAYEQVLEKNLTTMQTESLVRELLYEIVDGGDRLSKEELSILENKMKQVDPSILVSASQSPRGAHVKIIIPGNLAKTTSVLRKMIDVIRGG